ncbi:MAG: hypothetical protein WBW53_07770 [Terriglobales bacterium]
MPYPYTLAAAALLAGVCVFGGRLRGRSHHRRWISIAAGVSVATIFVDLLPTISEKQATFSANAPAGAALFQEQAVYLFAMLGFVLFYGLEYMVVSSPSGERKHPLVAFSLRIAAFALYSSFIAYLLVDSPWTGVQSLFLYSLAMAFHLLLVDHSLAEQGHQLYESRGRWILALAVMAGWSVGMIASIPELWLARITGFVCGGVIMNSLVVELPEGRGGRFGYFVLSAAIYAFVLIRVVG